ncbi:MAG: dioxygenase [Dehalococcoidia bacterium]
MNLNTAPLARPAPGALVLAALAIATACSTTPAPLKGSPVSRAATAVASAPAASAVAAAGTASIAPTPASEAGTCRPTAITPAQTEGPYYKANPPARASLIEAGTVGTRLVLTGVVYGTDCRPVSGARVDFWQADASGTYDNTTYRFRGYQATDAAGAYRLETVIPGEYPGRTEHIHVKITPPNGPTLTSQLYFPDVARNNADGIFDPKLLVQDFTREATGATAHFDFIVARR